jgi:glutamate racemase
MQTDARPRLIVFDSGIGGLSILEEIRRTVPEAAVAYVADNAGFPYGNLPDAVLIDRIEAVLRALLALTPADAVVVACNTASTIALPAVRARFALPFVGCVPAIKPAAALSRTGAIGLLATPATVRRPYTSDLIDRFAPDCRVVRVGAARLAALAEGKLRGRPVDPAILREETADLFAPDPRPVDVVVLGCTHYPFLVEDLRAVAPPGVRWLDSGAAVARRTRDVLAALPAFAGAGTVLPDDVAIFTAPPEGEDRLAEGLRRFRLPEIRVMDLAGAVPALAGA